MKLFGRKKSTTRQRLVTDDSKSASFSYNSSRRSEQPANTGRNNQREQKKAARSSFWHTLLHRSGLVLLLIVIAACLVNVLSLSGNAKVLPLESGSKAPFLRSQATYQAAADKLLASSIWNRNKITMDTGSLNRQMVVQFPELSSVSVTLPLLGHRPVVYLQPTQPALLLDAHNGSYVLDTNGKALLTSADLPPGHNLPQVTDESGLDVKLNRQVLNPGDVSFIQTVIAELAAKHVSVSSMNLPPASSELDAHIVGQPYFVKFNLQTDDARLQSGTFLATIAQLGRQHITPARYVDVRVEGRAYYQ
jgi:cell division septal protein FtsQ